MVFSRLGKRVKSLLGGDLVLEQLAAERRQQKEALELERAEFYSLFRPATAELEQARTHGLNGRSEQAGHHFSQHFYKRHRPFVFCHHSQADKVVTLYRDQPEGWKQLLTRAEQAVAHEFCPLRSQAYSFGSAIDWFSDFGGSSWYFGHVEDLRDRLQRDSQSGMRPIELTWTFNEHGHFLDLGRVYWVTQNETLVGEFLVQTADWAERNPVFGGINWLSGENIAARAVSWVTALQFFLRSAQLQGGPTARLVEQIILHGAVLAERLHQPDQRDRMAMASGLAIICLTLPELTCAQRWYELAGRHLAEGASLELDEEGFHRSGSSGRLRQALEWLLLPLLVSEQNRLPEPAGLVAMAVRGLRALALLTPPSGLVPDLGNPANTRFLARHHGPSSQTRTLLALGSMLVNNRPHFSADQCPVELLWWVGPNVFDWWADLPEPTSFGLAARSSSAGLAVIRQSWEPQASWAALRGRPEPPEAQQRPMAPARFESHDDHLSLLLHLDGEPVLLEPGGPSQPGSIRQAFSTLAAHSAPRVAREREPLSLSRTQSGPLPDVSLGRIPQGYYLGSSRPAWLMPDRPWQVQREVLFMPEKKQVAIRDQVLGEGELQFESSLLLSPHLDVLMRGDMGCLLRGKQLQARIVPIFPARFRYELKRGQSKPFAGWTWSESDQARPAHRLLYFTRLEAPFTIYLWLVWNPNDTKVPRIEELDRLFSQPHLA